MQKKLEKLGLRIKGDFTLHSGIKSSVKWNIEKLFEYPLHERLFYLRPWHRKVLKFIQGRDILIVGIPTGGYFLARDFATHYEMRYAHSKYHLDKATKKWEALIVDDVLTTGSTVNELFDKVDVLGVAVLINRSKLTTINNKPIISGIFADEIVCPLCKGSEEVLKRPARLIGATYFNDEWMGDEHFEKCPLCGKN